MGDKTILVTHRASAFARHAQALGLSVRKMGEPVSPDEHWEAVYWELSAMHDLVERNRIISRLLKAPKDCVRILYFDINGTDLPEAHLVRESLAYSDLLKIGKPELLTLCNLLGIASKSVFDCCFDLMDTFGIKTLILSHSMCGCHVFHGNTVSEKWGHIPLGGSMEEADGAFLAAYFAASRVPGKPFTDSHKQALAYLEQIGK